MPGEHLPRPDRPDLWRMQIFGPLIAALVAVGGLYGWSLHAPHTVAGLRAGGQPIGDVPFAELDAAVDKVADAVLDTRIVLAFGKDERMVKRRDLGFVVDHAAAKELVKSAGKSGNPLADVALRSRARRGKVDLDLPVDVDRAQGARVPDRAQGRRRSRAARRAARSRAPHHRQRDAGLSLARVRLDGGASSTRRARASARVELAAGLSWPKVKSEDLKDIDISTVLGNWETHYSSTGARHRSHLQLEGRRRSPERPHPQAARGLQLQRGRRRSHREGRLSRRAGDPGRRADRRPRRRHVPDRLDAARGRLLRRARHRVVDAALAAERVHPDGARLDGGLSVDRPEAAATRTTSRWSCTTR